MAAVDHVVSKLDVTCQHKQGTRCGTQEEINTLREFLGRQDTSGNVIKHIRNCLFEDDLTLELLSNFDDTSLQETIESWNIKYIHKKPHIIRGLLINGIKKIRQLNLKSRYAGVVLTEKEIIKREQLSKLENTIIHERKQFQNDHKTLQIEKNKLQHKYKRQIDSTFDNMIDNIVNRINTRREELLDKLDNIFEMKNKDYDKYSKYLDAILLTINDCKYEYEQNLESTIGYNNPNIQSRSDQNCELIDNVLTLSENKSIKRLKNSLNNTRYQCTVAFDTNKMVDAMAKHVSHFGTVQPKMGSVVCNHYSNHNVIGNKSHSGKQESKTVFDYEQLDERHQFYALNSDNLYDLLYKDEFYDYCHDCVLDWLTDVGHGVCLTTREESTLRCYLGSIYSRTKQCFVDARKEFRESIRLDNTNALTYNEYAKLLESLGECENALLNYQLACIKKPHVQRYKIVFQQAIQRIKMNNVAL